jgi:hypothetical protein
MPKSRVSRKKMFRDFSKIKVKYINNNYLKNLHVSRESFCHENKISWKHLEFLLWAYDLEFWTIVYASEEYRYSKGNLANRIVYPLLKTGHLYKHFDRLTPSNDMDDHLFRDETKYNYRVRYAITQKSRLLVQRFYQSL